MYSLDMGLLKAANSTALSWSDVQKPDLGSDYQPVMALAQNHVHFLNVPGVAAGSAKIFVIHCAHVIHFLTLVSHNGQFRTFNPRRSPMGTSPPPMAKRHRSLKTVV